MSPKEQKNKETPTYSRETLFSVIEDFIFTKKTTIKVAINIAKFQLATLVLPFR